jgi:hypothetical protein
MARAPRARFGTWYDGKFPYNSVPECPRNSMHGAEPKELGNRPVSLGDGFGVRESDAQFSPRATRYQQTPKRNARRSGHRGLCAKEGFPQGLGKGAACVA